MDTDAFLFDILEKYRPFGVDRDFNMLNICAAINSQLDSWSDVDREDSQDSVSDIGSPVMLSPGSVERGAPDTPQAGGLWSPGQASSFVAMPAALEPLKPAELWRHLQSFWKLTEHTNWPDIFETKPSAAKKGQRALKESGGNTNLLPLPRNSDDEDDSDEREEEQRWKQSEFELPQHFICDFKSDLDEDLSYLVSAAKRNRKKAGSDSPLPKAASTPNLTLKDSSKKSSKKKSRAR